MTASRDRAVRVLTLYS